MGLMHWDTEVSPAPAAAPAPAGPRPEKASWWRDPNPWLLGLGVGLFVTVVGRRSSP